MINLNYNHQETADRYIYLLVLLVNTENKILKIFLLSWFIETTRWDGLKVPKGTKYSLCTVSILTRKSSSQTYVCIFFQRTRIILLEILKNRKLWVNVSRNRTHTRNWSFCIKILEESVTDKTEKSLLLQISHLRFNITICLPWDREWFCKLLDIQHCNGKIK